MYRLTEILPAAKGDRLLLRISNDEGETVSLSVSCKLYAELGLRRGVLDGDTAERLFASADVEKATVKGLGMLGYGANSERRLKSKLRAKGFSEATAAEAVDGLVSRGYIDEKRDALRLSDSLLKKRYGRKRILSSLRAKGYGDVAVAAVEDALDGVDFTGLCAELIKIKFKELPKEPAEMKKALAKLVALGYNVSEAKNAMRAVARER